jgi:hypothetical protein
MILGKRGTLADLTISVERLFAGRDRCPRRGFADVPGSRKRFLCNIFKLFVDGSYRSEVAFL